MPRSLRTAALLAVLLSQAPALAQQASPRRRHKPPPDRWYGHQTLIVDGVGVSLLATGAILYGSSSRGGRTSEVGGAFMFSGGILFALVPPVIHMAHENVGWGFTSFVFRVLPAQVAIVGAGPQGGEDSSCEARYDKNPSGYEKCWRQDFKDKATAVGALALLSVGVDAFVFAWEKAPTVALSPFAIPRPGGAVGGVAGAF